MIFNTRQILPQVLYESFHSNARQLHGINRGGWVCCIYKKWDERQNSARTPRHQLLVPMEFEEESLKARGFRAVTLILEGKATVSFDKDITLQASPGSLIWFDGHNPEVPFVAAPGTWECSFCIEAETARRIENAGLMRFERRLDDGILSASRVLDFYDMFRAISESSLSEETILRRSIAFIDRLLSPHITPFGTQNDWVRRACLLLETRVEPTFTMLEASKIIVVNYREFRRHFRERMGVSPISYQLEARMRLARRLLIGRTVKEVADLLGYEDPFLFSRQFKKTFGMAPSLFH